MHLEICNDEGIKKQLEKKISDKSEIFFELWALRDSNPRPSGCKPDALNQLS